MDRLTDNYMKTCPTIISHLYVCYGLIACSQLPVCDLMGILQRKRVKSWYSFAQMLSAAPFTTWRGILVIAYVLSPPLHVEKSPSCCLPIPSAPQSPLTAPVTLTTLASLLFLGPSSALTMLASLLFLGPSSALLLPGPCACCSP